jgi:hypothetical protein
MTTITTYERPDLAQLERLIQSNALSNAEIHALKSLKEKIDTKTSMVKVEYSLEGFGRFKATAKGGKYKTSTTATGLKREIRNILYGEAYDDLDIANASGEVMCQLFQKNGLNTEKMSYLNAHRQEVFEMIMDFHEQKIEKQTAKDIMIEVFFGGGGHSSQYWEFNPFTNKKETIIRYALPPFVEEFKKEYQRNLATILGMEMYKPLKESVMKKEQERCERTKEEYKEPWLGQYGATLYQDEERKILEVMVKAIRKMETQRKVKDALGALIYDGLHVKKEFDIAKQKEQLEASILGETGYRLKLEIKSMEVDEKTRIYYLGNDEDKKISYEAYRSAFEKTRFKTKNGKYPFHTIKGDDIVSRDKTSFNVANEDWMRNAGEFLKEWFADPYKRSYEEIEYACVKEEDRTDDIYYAFPTLRYKTLASVSTAEEKQANITFFQEYVSLLVEGNPIFTGEAKDENEVIKQKWAKWMTFWIADILLNPDDKGKQPIAIILWSKQGSGKTSLRVLMEKLLGERCVHHTQDPTKNGDILHEFNSKLKYKLFLEFEEINMKIHSQVVDAIKQLITNHTHTITHKGQDSVDVKASERSLFTTNNPVSAVIEKGDRRYTAFAMSDKRVGDTEYWKQFYEKANNNNFLKDIADYLCSFKEEVNLFAFRDERPITTYYKSLLQLSLPAELDFLKDKLFYHSESMEAYEDDEKTTYVVPSTTLSDMYNEWRKAHSLETKVTSKSFTAKMEALATDYGISHKKMSSYNAFVINIAKSKEMLKKDFALQDDEPEIMRVLNRPAH